MAKRNPINLNTQIDILSTIKELTPAYGLFSDSGLFKEVKLTSKTFAYDIERAVGSKMTRLTSRTERDSVRTGKTDYKTVALGTRSIKVDQGVHIEDLEGRVTGGIDLENLSDTVLEELAKKVQIANDSLAQSFEYMLVTGSQGQVRDPKDGTVAIDMFAETGTQRPTAVIDLTAGSTTVKSGLNALRNQVSLLNFGHGSVREIELWVAGDVFDALSTSVELETFYLSALNGNVAALTNPIINGSVNKYVQGKYGFYREFRWENFVFRTYPTVFHTMTGGTLNAVEDGKGWTVVRGTTDSYELGLAPAPYLSQFGKQGQKIFAKFEDVNDVSIDFTLESHIAPVLKRPELAVEVTFTLD